MAITELKTSRKFKLKTVKCDRDDIKYILKLLEQSEIKYRDFRIDKYELENENDIDELKIERANYFYISGTINDDKLTYFDKNIEIIFGDISCSINISDYRNIKLNGLATALVDYFKKKKKNISYIFIFPFALWFAWVFLMKTDLASIYTPQTFIFLTATIICQYYLFRIAGKPLIMIKAELQKNFFVRNKDNIIVNIIFLILGGLVGYFIAIFTKKP